MRSSCKKSYVIGTPIAVTNRPKAAEEIIALANTDEPAYVCFATAHMLVEVRRNQPLRQAYDRATVVHADGRPVCWALRLTGNGEAECVSGPQLTPELLRKAVQSGVPVGFYGGRPETLEKMLQTIGRDFPGLNVAYCYSPPFRALTGAESEKVRQDIKASGAKLLFVGLGSPKQELWMAENSPHLPCVLLGVGAVFEFLSGEKHLPPVWVQELGLTWLIRLCQEPRRLMRRNLVYSPLFVGRFLQEQLLSSAKAGLEK